MPNAYANKVQVTRGGQTETLIDLTSDTVTASTLMQGYTAHDASGAPITGTATGGGSGSAYQDQDGYIVLDDEGGGSITVEPLPVTQNGTYTAPTGTAYSPVTVNVSGGYPVVGDGFTYLHVNVWSELALTMYVRFASVASDVSVPIDWGDGSAIETVTARSSMATYSHTYASTGTYTIVLRTTLALKLGGSSSYGLLCNNAVSTSEERSHRSVLVAAEFGRMFDGNSNIGSYWCAYNFALEKATFISTLSATQPVYIAASAFAYCYSLREIELRKTKLATIGNSAFAYCYSLRSIDLSGTTTIGNSAFTYCQSLLSVTIPSTVTSLGNSVFSYCNSLKECHVKSSTPPTIGTSVFSSVSSDFKIYVPQGSLTSYQEAENWSTYASKMQEEA